jgi:hypothetical protein
MVTLSIQPLFLYYLFGIMDNILLTDVIHENPVLFIYLDTLYFGTTQPKIMFITETKRVNRTDIIF